MPLIAALTGMYGGWLPVVYFLWKDRPWRPYWALLNGLWVLSWLLTYQVWPSSPPSEGDSPALRIATWNLDASDYDRKRIDRDLVFLAERGADIVCLQEVYLGNYSPECFAEKAGYPYILFGKAGPAMGMAILSRYPVWLHEHPLLLPGSTNGILMGKVLLPGGDTILVVNVHYPSYRLARLSSWQYAHWHSVWEAQSKIDALLEMIIKSWSGPIWIGGDFNSIPLSYAAGQWWRNGLRDSYFSAGWLEGPTWRPIPLRIDYVWGPCPAHHQTICWTEHHHHAYVLAEYSEKDLTAVTRKSTTFARLGR